MLPAIGDAESLTNRYGRVLEIRAARNQFQVFGDLFRMREDVIGNHQDFSGELGQEDLYLLRKTPAVRIEKHQIERPGEMADNLSGVARTQIHAVEQIRAPKILARQGVFVGIAVDAD